jgi:molybdate transport system substrate-binding protein
MKRRFSLVSTGLVILMALSVAESSAFAAELRVLTANPLSEGLKRAGELFKRETGNDVKVEVPAGGEVNRILASDEPADILVSLPPALERAIMDGKVSGGKLPVGKVAVGIMVRRGAAVPNIATPDAVKQAVLGADTVIYNTAPSGQYVQKMLEQFGVIDQIKNRTARPANGVQSMERMLAGKGNEVGFGLLSEIRPFEDKGVQLVGRLPDSLQNYTVYDGVILSRSKSLDVARQFMSFLNSPAGRQAFASTGVD